MPFVVTFIISKFQNSLKIRITTFKLRCLCLFPDSIQEDQFLQDLSKSILYDVNWSCKGKYGILSVLVGHLGSARMLQWHAGISRLVLQQLHEQTLACYVSVHIFWLHLFCLKEDKKKLCGKHLDLHDT